MADIVDFPPRDLARRRRAISPTAAMWRRELGKLGIPLPAQRDPDVERERKRIGGRHCRHLTRKLTGMVLGVERDGETIFAKLWAPDGASHVRVESRMLVPEPLPPTGAA